MLELADKYFNAATIKILKELKNMVTINEEIKNFNRGKNRTI